MKVLVLDATNKSIQVVMGGAAATNDPDFTAHYSDSSVSAFTEGANDGTLNGTTPVTLVAAPAASTQRVVKEFIISNTDTDPVEITITYESGANSRRLWFGTLQPNETLTSDGTFDENGALKTAIATIPAHGHTGSSDGGQLNAGSVFSAGQVQLERGGTEADLSATGGAGQVVKQSSTGAAFTVGALVDSEIPNLPASKITTGQLLLERGGTEADLSATGPGHVIQATNGAVFSTVKDNFAGTAAPSATDDGAAGYSVGSYWYDTTNDKAYVCLDATNSAAIWRLISNLLTTKGDILTYSTLPLRLAVGARDGDALIVDSASAAGLKYGVPKPRRAIIGEEQTSGTAGGSSTATTWTTRVINTETSDPDSIVTISSNKFTPIAGTWRVRAVSSFAGSTGGGSTVRIRLRNVTTGTVVISGVNYGMVTSGFAVAEVEGVIVANGTDEFDVQYWVSASRATIGLGAAASEGTNEIYTRVFIEG